MNSENREFDLGLNKAQVLMAIESLKIKGIEVSPNSISEHLAIPKTFLYADLEILETIYRYSSSATGVDLIIQNLLTELKSSKRKNARLVKLVEKANAEMKKTYSQGFAKGASVNYATANLDTSPRSAKKSAWARGALYLPMEEDLSPEQIKKAYRKMASHLHPDKNSQNTQELFMLLQSALNILEEN